MTGNKNMDNNSYQQDQEEGTELGLVQQPDQQKRTNGTAPGPSTSCRPEVCEAARRKYMPPDLSESPWHRFKTIALLVTIGLLIVWIIIYSILSQLDIV